QRLPARLPGAGRPLPRRGARSRRSVAARRDDLPGLPGGAADRMPAGRGPPGTLPARRGLGPLRGPVPHAAQPLPHHPRGPRLGRGGALPLPRAAFADARPADRAPVREGRLSAVPAPPAGRRDAAVALAVVLVVLLVQLPFRLHGVNLLDEGAVLQ